MTDPRATPADPELKPCPFCGGKANIERQGTARRSSIIACEDCGCRLETGEIWSVGERWNTREGSVDSPAGQVGCGAIPLADHDEIGRKVFDQPWEIQKAIVTIAAHCLVLKDPEPDSSVSDLAGSISQCCLDLANALTASPVACGEPVAWFAVLKRARHRNMSEDFRRVYSKPCTACNGTGGMICEAEGDAR